MAQINLLKQTPVSSDLWRIVPNFLVRFFSVVLIVLLGYYGWLFYSSSRTSGQITQIGRQMQSDQQTALNTPGRDELLTRQQQIKELKGLVSQHVYWSRLMPVLAKATLKKATYSSLAVDPNGIISLQVTVPTMEDLDRYLQVFDLPEINKYFYDVKVNAFHKVQDKTSTSILFEVQMKFDPSIIQYASQASSLNNTQ